MSAALPRSLPDHPCWLHIAPFITVEAGTLLATGRKHRRIEVHTGLLSEWQIAQVLGVRIGCVACGKPVSPFRRRRGKSAGRTTRPSRLFVALTCQLTESVACSRGQAATAGYEQLIAALQRLGTCGGTVATTGKLSWNAHHPQGSISEVARARGDEP